MSTPPNRRTPAPDRRTPAPNLRTPAPGRRTPAPNLGTPAHDRRTLAHDRRPDASIPPPTRRRTYIGQGQLRNMAMGMVQNWPRPPQQPPFNFDFELLPDELQCRIMMNCPIKTVMRSRVVNKNLNTCLSGTHFTNKYRCKSQSKCVLHSFIKIQRLAYGTITRGSYMEWSLYSNVGSLGNYSVCFDVLDRLTGLIVKPVWSINGLVLFEAGTEDQNNDKVRFLFNPILTEVLFLPKPEPERTPKPSYLQSIGFGVVGDQYKVVILSSVKAAHVLRLGSGEWWKLSVVPHIQPARRAGTTLEGFIHWNTHVGGDKIWRFDLNTEIFSQLPSPPTDQFLRSAYAPPQLGILEGKLCITYSCLSEFSVWVMQSYEVGSSWTRCIMHDYRRGPYRNPLPDLNPLTMRLLMKLKKDNEFAFVQDERRLLRLNTGNSRTNGIVQVMDSNIFFDSVCYEPTLLNVSTLFNFEYNPEFAVIPKRIVNDDLLLLQ